MSTLSGPGHGPEGWKDLETTILGQLELVLRQLFNVDILEGHDPHVLDEPCRPVDIPYPGIRHGDVEVDLTTLTADLHVNGVCQVETTLRLDDVSEQPHDIAILPIELELHLGLVLLQVLRAHDVPRSSTTLLIDCLASLASGLGPHRTIMHHCVLRKTYPGNPQTSHVGSPAHSRQPP